MTSWGRRPGDGQDETPIRADDLAWRIGASNVRPAPTADQAGGLPPVIGTIATPSRSPLPVRAGSVTKAHARPAIPGAVRRRVLWRDASALLLVLVIVLVVGQLARTTEPLESGANPGSAGPSNQALGATATPDGAGGPTRGPVIDPGLIPGLEATPTPVPTQAPTVRPRVTPRPTSRSTPRPSAAPTPTLSPSATPEASPSPSPASTPSPDQSPAPTPEPTPTPTEPPSPAPTPTPIPPG